LDFRNIDNIGPQKHREHWALKIQDENKQNKTKRMSKKKKNKTRTPQKNTGEKYI